MLKDGNNISQRPKINPSARPSIHNSIYSSSYSEEPKMVRPLNSSANNGDQDSDGYDELDNVMSKFARSGTPVLRRKNSIDFSPDKSLDDLVDDVIFSKSLPAYLPSHCSDISGASKRFSPKHSPKEDSIPNSNIIRKRNPPSYILESSGYSTNTSFDSSFKEEKSNYFFSGFISFIILITAYFAYQYYEIMTHSANHVYDESMFYNDLNNIGRKYGISENSVLQIQTGISTIFEKQDAGSFIFVYNSNRYNFKPIELHNFIEAVALSTARYLRNDSKSIRHVIVDTSYKNIQSDGELITKYREDVSKTGVMLVKEVDNVPSSLAMAFHYYCDEYNPVVKKSAIFFTLDMARCPTNIADQKPNQSHIERCLANKWSSVPKDNIGPLLTRVVDIVVDVTSLK